MIYSRVTSVNRLNSPGHEGKIPGYNFDSVIVVGHSGARDKFNGKFVSKASYNELRIVLLSCQRVCNEKKLEIYRVIIGG